MEEKRREKIVGRNIAGNLQDNGYRMTISPKIEPITLVTYLL